MNKPIKWGHWPPLRFVIDRLNTSASLYRIASCLRSYTGYLWSSELPLKYYCMLTFKALNNLAPPYLSQLIVPYNPTRNLRSAGKHLLEVPNVCLKSYGSRAFSVATPKHWNEIPLDIKLSRSVDVFKSRLKTYLFRLAFN